jgi:hypothetical protein
MRNLLEHVTGGVRAAEAVVLLLLPSQEMNRRIGAAADFTGRHTG